MTHRYFPIAGESAFAFSTMGVCMPGIYRA
jgi:hypothetical protein